MCCSCPDWILVLRNHLADRSIVRAILTQLVSGVPHVGKIIQCLFLVIDVQMRNMEHGSFNSTIHRKGVIEVLSCLCDEFSALRTNRVGEIPRLPKVATDVSTTSLNCCPIHTQRLHTMLRCLHWIWHLLVCHPVTAERDIVGVVTCHEHDASLQGDCAGMQAAQFPSCVWTAAIFIWALKFALRATPRIV